MAETKTKNASDSGGVEPVRDQHRSPRDEPPPAGTSGGISGISRSDWAMFGAIAAIAIAIGIVNALSTAQDAAGRGNSYDPGRLVFWELSSIAVILLAMPILVLAVRRLRRTSRWLPRIAIAAAALISFSSIHIAGMVAIRKFVLWMIGSSYEFNASFATLLYEFRKDAVTSILIGSTIWLVESRLDLMAECRSEAGAPATARPELPH